MNKLLLVLLLLLTSVTAFCEEEVLPEVYVPIVTATNPNEIVLNDCLDASAQLPIEETGDAIKECYRVFNEEGTVALQEDIEEIQS